MDCYRLIYFDFFPFLGRDRKSEFSNKSKRTDVQESHEQRRKGKLSRKFRYIQLILQGFQTLHAR
jgi:hypothetical protein